MEEEEEEEENPDFVDVEIEPLSFSLTEMSLLIRILKMISIESLDAFPKNEQYMYNIIGYYSQEVFTQVGISDDFFRTTILKKLNGNMKRVNF